ncbi:MAG: hypothetical protein IPM38_05220 [Ignavibacteria bacterium]|nr:hypothetical protein [Ignavibacteria bacterium]
MKIISNYLFVTMFFSVILFSCSDNKKDESIELKTFSGQNKNQIPDNDQQEELSSGATDESNLKGITAPEIKNHIGEIVTVNDIVTGVHVTEKVAYLNFGNKFPKNDFSGVVFAGKYELFGDLNVFNNKRVEITGNVSIFRNKPQIILNSPDQIKIIK